jgi:DNA polymerase-3 subunit chi
MAELRFYHLQRQAVDQALPGLLSKALKNGHRIVVKVDNSEEASRLNAHLWTYRSDSFLPHGAHEDGNAAWHPVWLTSSDDNPNGADIAIVTGTAELPDEFASRYTMCCLVFDERNDNALQRARYAWKTYRDDDSLRLTYWQQGESGWEQKQTG